MPKRSTSSGPRSLVRAKVIERAILVIRGKKVLLDADLASLYGVETRTLLQAVKRNGNRFPDDFLFQLTTRELAFLRSQNVISNEPVKRGGRRYRPFAFTEEGVAMLSSVLHSPRAAQVNVEIMRAFVRLAQALASNSELRRRIDDLEENYDAQFKVVFDAIRGLMTPAPTHTSPIGFRRRGRND